MSIKLMSAIFETEFRDLIDAEGNVTKASTAKLVCLALADHANDEGEGAYPGLTLMERKTALSRQGIINTYDALKFNGIIFLEGESRLGTNNYTINKGSFPHPNDDSKATLLVKPLDYPGKATLPEVVKPLDLNHPLTIIEPSNGVPPSYPVEWQIAGSNETIVVTDDFENKAKDAANLIATGMGSMADEGYWVALAFMKSRKILFTESQIKGQRKAAKALIQSRVLPIHVKEAVDKLLSDGMTVTDLYSVTKTAISLANPAPETIGYNPQGLTIS